MIAGLRRGLARHVDEDRVRAAIEEGEAQTSGRIHVTLAPHFWGSVRRAAERAFERFRLADSEHRNSVLFFVVPSRRELVVLGDAGIHGKAGQEFWDRIALAVSETIKNGDLTSGLVHGIQEAGRELARHYPRTQPHTTHTPPSRKD